MDLVVRQLHSEGILHITRVGRRNSYRVSDHAVRCGLKTWKRSGSVHWTCYGHINNFFAPPSSRNVSTQSRGVYCKS